MPDIICCPTCRRQLKLPDEFMGKAVRCPACGMDFVAGASAPPRTVDPPMVLPAPPRGRHADDDRSARRPRPAGASPQRRARPPITRSQSWTTLAVLGAILGGLLLLIVGVTVMSMALVDHRQSAPPPPVPWERQANEELAQKEFRRFREEEVQEPFKDQKALTEDEIALELKPFLETLHGAFQRRDPNALTFHFNAPRLYDEMQALEILPKDLLPDRLTAIRQLRAALGAGLAELAQDMQWESADIHHVKKLKGNEAIVTVHHRPAVGSSFEVRWWVTKRTGAWQAFDFEDQDVGMRFATMDSNIASVGVGIPALQELSGTVATLRQAAVAIGVHRKADLADKELQTIAQAKLPRTLEAVRWHVTALIRQQRGQAIIEAADKALELCPDMPCPKRVKGIALNRLGQWAKALPCLEAYRDTVGYDAVLCRELGEALRGVRRFDEAVKVYRKALDLNPKNADTFLGLLRALGPKDKRDDLGERFARLDAPHQSFELLSADCKQARDGAALEQIALAMQKIDPRYAEADFCLALTKVWAQKPDEAAALLKLALAKEDDPARRKEYTAGLLQALAQAGSAAKAYAAAEDAAEAFRTLAAELKKSYRSDDLSRLVAVHAKKHPGDPLLPFYQGEVHVQDGNYALADKAFSAGMLKPPPQHEDFRISRVTAKYHTGQALAAYAEIGPRHDTFQQLANLCLGEGEGKLELLEALLKIHAKNFPDDVDMITCKFRLKIKQSRTEEAAVLFRSVLAKPLHDSKRQQIVTQFLYDMVDAGKALEAYQAAPDGDKTFQRLADDLSSQGRTDDLRRLLEAHRKNSPEDVWLKYHTANLHVKEKAWDEAIGILKQALKEAPPDANWRFRNLYVLALYKAGKVLQAYQEVEPRKETYLQLAGLLLHDRKGAELEALVAAHRPHAVAGEEVDLHQARAHVLLMQPDLAVVSFKKALELQADELMRQNYVREFVRDMADAGHGLAAYRAAPDKQTALQTLAGDLVFKKKAKELGELLTEHGKEHQSDRWYQFYEGEWHLLRGRVLQAETMFAAALAQTPAPEQWSFRNGLWRARVQAGKAIAIYNELGGGSRSFQDVAHVCLQTKNAGQLEALLAAHRQAEPEDASTVEWDVEIRWLKKDYEGTLQLLDEHAKTFALPRYQWKCENHLVRCLVKLKRFDEAVRRADAIAKRKFGNRMLQILARAARGDVQDTIAVMAKHAQDRFLVGDCYRDDDLGAILRSDAFRPFQERFPEPPMTERFDDDRFDD
jgi:tetratricopeptide (TPR) repeat protein